MSDVQYTPDGHPYVPDEDDGRPRITVRPRVRDLVDDGMVPGSGANPLQMLQATEGGELAPGQGGALHTLLSSLGSDASRFVTSMATAPYRMVNEQIGRRMGEPLSSDDAGLDASMEAAGLAMGGGMPLTPRGALGTSGSRAMTAPPKVGPFYSAVEQAIAEAPQAKMTPEQWSGYLRNRPGVKAEELDFMGLDRHYSAENWQGPVTREQMLETARDHGVKLKEVEKKGAQLDDDAIGERAMEIMDEEHPGLPRNEKWDELFDDALVRADDELRGGEGGGGTGTKFHEYQLPGGDNYRELLLTMPETKGKKPLTAAEKKEFTRLDTRTYRGPELTPAETARLDELTARTTENDWAGPPQNRDVFTSSHWDEPNVLVHMRMNDRRFGGSNEFTPAEQASYDKLSKMDYDKRVANGVQDEWDRLLTKQESGEGGLKSLHLEEVQSDWHQQGRKKGYNGQKVDTSQWTAQYHEKGGPHTGNYDPGTPFFAVKGADGTGIGVVPTSSAIKTAEDAIKSVAERTAVVHKEAGVPDAPFKSTWADLALKRAITKAAEEGYDAVSWTPGKTHFDRYGSEMVNWEKTADGKWNIKTSDHVGPQEAEVHSAGLGKGNSLVVSSKEELYAAVKKIADGDKEAKKITDRVWDRMQTENKGTSLPRKEGMEGFYDKMLVDKANALGKKFGAKVEWQTLPGEPMEVKKAGNITIGKPEMNTLAQRRDDIVGVYEDGKFFANFAKNEVDQLKKTYVEKPFIVESPSGSIRFKTKQEADDYVKSHEVKVPVLRLNDKLRAAASTRGLPLFSSGLPFKFTPVDHDPFNDPEPLR